MKSIFPLLPGSTIGVVGGGQLGRMFVLEARRMGYRTVVLDPDPASPAAQISDERVAAQLADVDAARDFASRVDVVTLEWENADLATMRVIESLRPVRPGTHVLEVAQNRVLEKEHARKLGLQTAPFHPVRSLGDLHDGLRRIGYPCVLKTATGGYDGRGQSVLRAPEEADAAYRRLAGPTGDELILEGWVDFAMEASVICARSANGEMKSFPIAENIHAKGILDFTLAPARLPEDVQARAARIGELMTEGLNVVGLLAVELFVTDAGEVLVNEIAPRPHNSGHYTIEACTVSQFEQQLRAVCGLPLAEPRLLKPACMANLLGEHIGTGGGLTSVAEALGTDSLALHLYGKREGRPGRKMGHLTVLGESAEGAFEEVARVRSSIKAEYDARSG